MLTLFKTRTSLAAATVLIFLAGGVAGFWRYHYTRDVVLTRLVVDARRCALAFEPADLRALSGTRADLHSPAYAQVKDRLMRLRTAEASIRFVYIFRAQPGSSEVVFLADSEPADSGDVSFPGDAYPEAAASPGLQAILATGQPATEGPLTDQFGTWITGYAPIGSRVEGQPIEVLGLDLSVDDWRRTLWSAAAGTAIYVWMFLILPFVATVATRRQSEQRDALRNLTEAMEQAHAAVVVVNLDRRIDYVNAGFSSLVGYSRRELIGQEWRNFQDTNEPAHLFVDLVTTVRAGLPWSGQWMMRRKDGSRFPVRALVSPVKTRSGEIRSYVAVFEDMTEIHHTEKMLREAKERAEAGDRAKGQFLATMSHEVRTPLNGIVGFSSLLLETELTPEQQEFVETIRTSSETLIQLTGDILDYARIESGRLKLEPQPFDPRECVENALDLVASPAMNKNIELLHWVDEAVPPAIVADVSRLRQVLVNLVNNAVKFTMEGEVEVRVRVLPAPAQPGGSDQPWPCTVLEFSVRDTGIGIPAMHHDRIFRPFSQVDDSTTRRFGGTGLGLAICKNIVELMGGTITFASEVGRGSTFTFTVRAGLHPSEGPAPVRPPAGQRWMVVSAHPGLCTELQRVGARLQAVVTTTGLAELATRSDWDLAIVDVTGPLAMSIASLRTPRAGLPPEKLIALVPIVLPAELRTALRKHFRLVLNKPLHHDMLASMLATVPVAASMSAPPFPVDKGPRRFDLDVLVVEDNPVNLRLIQTVLDNLGCRWTTASNGRAGLEQLARQRPDLVLMDLHMPEMDGLSAILKIRAGEAGASLTDIWIIALTADARPEQRDRTLAAGADDYLTKPLHLPDLTAALQRFLAARRS